MLSTFHNDDKLMKLLKMILNQKIIAFYNALKGWADSVDQMCSTYNCAQNTRSWPMVMFYSLLNVAGINGYIIYYKNKNKKTRVEFLEKLCLNLSHEQMLTGANCGSFPVGLRFKISKFIGYHPFASKPPTRKRGRYHLSVGKNRKTNHYCLKCYKFLC